MRIVPAGKIVLGFMLCFACFKPLQGQKMHYFDLRKFNLGFNMGFDIGSYWWTNQPNQTDLNPARLLKRMTIINKPGINLGLITSLKLANHWDLRFIPSVSLEQRDFDCYFQSRLNPAVDSVVRKKVEASYFNIPFAIKFKSDFHKVYRLYILAGMQMSINMNNTKKIRNDPNLIKTDVWDLSSFAAIGIDLYGEKLKLSPEIRYHLGFNDLYIRDNTNFPSAISNLYSSTIVFCLNFE